MILSILLLLSGLAISGVAEFYSIMGLMAIFSAAPIPIAIMGISLGVGKLVIASWIKAYWEKAPLLMRSYGVVSVCILMMITTLGCFGYLSKAHSDQTLVSGDVQAKVAIYDERIKTEKDNIEADRKQLNQMDAAVDQVLSRTDDEKGATKANEIRRSQLKDRSRLQNEILESQKKIAIIQDERAPFAAENRKVEAEVGPIKYIAAFVYGSNPDASILERAVTWVIILIVVVFDPLAVVMLLASQMTFAWIREDKKPRKVPELDDAQTKLDSETFSTLDDAVEQAREQESQVADLLDSQLDPVELTPFTVAESVPLDIPVDVVKSDPRLEELQTHIALVEQDRDDLIDFVKQNQEDYNKISDLHFRSMQREQVLTEEINKLNYQLNQVYEELVAKSQPVNIVPVETVNVGVSDTVPTITEIAEPVVEEQTSVEMTKDMQSEIVADLAGEPLPETASNTVPETAPRFKATQEPQPEAMPRNKGPVVEEPIVVRKPVAGFGTDFPNNPLRGDMFLRTDFKPSRLFKWNDTKWIEINKATTDAYTYNDAYIQYLAEKLLSGEYGIDDLSEVEQQQIQTYMGTRYA